MRKLLAFLAGAIFALATGYMRADYSSADTQDTDKIMRDDDHSRVEAGQEQTTIHRPGEPGNEGSGAGGAQSSDMDKYNGGSGKEPGEQTPSGADPYKDMPGY